MATANTNTPTNVQGSTAHTATPIADKVTETLHSSVDTLSSSVSKAEDSIRKAAVNTSASAAIQKAKMERTWDRSSVKKYAVENPVATAGIAFAAGALLTSLLTRK